MLAEILAHLRTQPSRTGSMIVTLYGDAIVPRGGSLALSSLIDIFRGLGIEDGVVRTAVSRLAADGWLIRSKRGRNSFYAISPSAAAATEAATPRIYGPISDTWDGHLRLAIDPGAERQSLLDAGWATVHPGVLIATTGPSALTSTGTPEALLALAARAWPLAGLAGRYHSFLATFPADIAVTEADAIRLRLLLIHEFRRIALRDPALPRALLPADWPGHPARARAATLYASLLPLSEHWLDTNATTETGPLPHAIAPRRFG